MEFTNHTLDVLKTLKVKDFITIGGILTTSFISFKTLRYTKKNNNKSFFINSITKERVESMGELKEQVARYLSIASRHALIKEYDKHEVSEFIKELEYSTMRIAFQLNPNNNNEERIYNELKKINAIIRYIVFHIDSENENLYPTGLLNLIDDYNIKISDFYINYSQDKLIYSNISLANKVFNQFKGNYNSLLEKTLKRLINEVRMHLKEEWNKIKCETELK